MKRSVETIIGLQEENNVIIGRGNYRQGHEFKSEEHFYDEESECFWKRDVKY